MSWLNSFNLWFDKPLKEARQRVTDYVKKNHQDLQITNLSLRAKEPTRYIFAVFYNQEDKQVIPGRYLLISISRENGYIEELPTSPDSPYWIRGRK